MTPEGVVKENVKKLLAEHGLIAAKDAVLVTPEHTGWYFMPVPGGMGVSGVPDFLGNHRGRFFSIETKDAGKHPTKLQSIQIRAIRLTGGTHFTIDGDLRELDRWLGGREHA